ncbi:hypothetical protein NCCP2222_15940 [Sporosarcina sp. NCCP-2222]|uniref:S-layer homology domain-containing protein n=1 Tax=Sporosarcina sp. NCCP-2222 TaxID=2935073 RepID=UPI00207F9C0F|nr:S-layer homology domain-containing protein [Sporosarcina sp. NCCP-2222]GKV55647.1 hypothetical protein NCCP2222_15940 [Sporosarcina sp. NCCP-2222]
MKNMKFVFPFLVAAALVTAPNVEANERQTVQEERVTPFTDITNEFRAKNEILWLVDNGILTGFRDLQFRPSTAMTMGEAAQAFHRVISLPGLPTESGQESLNDEMLVQAMQNAEIFQAPPNGMLTKESVMTMGQLKTAIRQAFELTDDKVEEIWPAARQSQGKAALFGIKNPVQKKVLLERGAVDRATFSAVFYNAMKEKNMGPEDKNYELSAAVQSPDFSPVIERVHLEKVSFDEHPIYLRSEKSIRFTGHTRIDNDFSRDNIYLYDVGEEGTTIELTVRSFDNGDYFLFSKLENPTDEAVTVDVLQKENYVDSYELYRFDQHPIKRNTEDLFNADLTSYPTGVLRFLNQDGSVQERMVGQSYRSRQLAMEYAEGGRSGMRELLAEEQSLSFTQIGSTFMSVHALKSEGNDMVDQWYLNSENMLFNEDAHRESWMLESAQYYKKRNNWYTAIGPFNKMVTTTEPLPENGQGYGRSLLHMKEDRAMTLFHEQQDRYFENLIYNAFVNLKNFRGDKPYWETEVTSTYLKGLYGITAPFIDTRFNEQIALFYYRSGDEFDISEYKEPLRNYADLLVSQKEQGHVIPVAKNAYYISDYFPIIQEGPTHASMNHVLGGMNILLMAYNEFGDDKYLETAKSIQNAIVINKNDWIRDNGDIWYRIAPDYGYKGDDYKHLTLEDLINSYSLWEPIDPSYLPVLEEMIASKASYLSNEKLGYTTKIKNGLSKLGLLKYLPDGEERTDAL